MNHTHSEAWNKSTFGKMCEKTIPGIIVCYILALSIIFTELTPIYFIGCSLCFIKDFKVMMTQVK